VSNLKVYLETSFISYLTARPNRDLIVTANQQITREWWETYRDRFDLYISQVVTLEASLGDPEAAQQRLEIIQNLPQLELNELTLHLAQRFLETRTLPDKANRDALHIACAIAHGVDFLLT